MKAPDPPDLPSLLVQYRPQLLAFAEREAGRALLRYESADDLVQNVHQEALGCADRFEWRSEKEFLSWVYTVARRCFSSRRAHWFAAKRDCSKVLRLNWSGAGSDQSPFILDQADTGTGPSTFAFRREILLLVTKAMALLLPRDRDIVRWMIEGIAVKEQAARQGLSHEAAARAQSRALERLRKAYRLLTQHAGDAA